jgi:hypothetical protein
MVQIVNDFIAATVEYRECIAAIAAYSFCSSFMLIVNKWVITNLPAPTLVSCVQLIGCIISVLVASCVGLTKLDIVGKSELKWLFLYSGGLLLSSIEKKLPL